MQQLSDIKKLEVERQKREREDFLNWISLYDYEEAHDNTYSKKHAGTGNWLVQTDEFRIWDNSQKSALPWCHGKRK